MTFDIHAKFQPQGDQPQAIKELSKGITNQEKNQVLLGVTGSGKTFTIANVIQQTNKPTLILSHNKTLVAQLYGEFKQFFPHNAVEYFVSYYDYYQPEAYLPSSDTYIEKDLSINEEVEKLRLSTTSSLLSGRRDIIVLASVSAIYGMGNPSDYKDGIIHLQVGQVIDQRTFLFDLVSALYARTEDDFCRGNFRIKGDTVDVFLPYADFAYRIIFFGDEIESIQSIDPTSGKTIERNIADIAIFPANMYVTPKELLHQVIFEIQDELNKQVAHYKEIGKHIEATRLTERVHFDIEMMRELGYCSGIENYSRFLDRRQAGTRPYCLLDYFPDDYLLVIDESHVSIPQISAMYGGDRARKINLVEYGFRLPSAMDNRPLNFQEFESLINQVIFVSATPAKYELEKTEGLVVEQIVRPTGLLDPTIDVRPSKNQIDDLLEEIDERIKVDERILVTTLTKRMAEELNKYFVNLQIRSRYIHSDVDTMDRVEIIRDLRIGKYDVLVGVNLLREGLDMPEVSLVAILDADKEGFLRNERSLTQTAGRAARNENGKVIMYADKITASMQRTIDETKRRRKKQIDFNKKHHIQPKSVRKSKEEILSQSSILDIRPKNEIDEQNYKADSNTIEHIDALTQREIKQMIKTTKKKMQKASKNMDFLDAAKYRDIIKNLEKKISL